MLLAILDLEWKVIQSFLDAAANDGGQNHGIATTNGDGTGCLAAEETGFNFNFFTI